MWVNTWEPFCAGCLSNISHTKDKNLQLLGPIHTNQRRDDAIDIGLSGNQWELQPILELDCFLQCDHYC